MYTFVYLVVRRGSRGELAALPTFFGAFLAEVQDGQLAALLPVGHLARGYLWPLSTDDSRDLGVRRFFFGPVLEPHRQQTTDPALLHRHAPEAIDRRHRPFLVRDHDE